MTGQPKRLKPRSKNPNALAEPLKARRRNDGSGEWEVITMRGVPIASSFDSEAEAQEWIDRR